jgi:hypothetical protein
MKVNRLELIEKVRGMIEARETEMAARRARDEEAAEKAQVTYMEEHGADWNQFNRNVSRRVRRGEPVTPEDIPDGLRYGRNMVEVFRPVTIRESNYVANVGYLRRLAAILESSPDEFVSTSALDRIGAPIKELMRP